MRFNSLSWRNIARRPGRSFGLGLLVALLSLSIFGGTMIISSLRNGMKSLEGRLGADIIVVPSSMKSKVNLDNIWLSGTGGYFYMDSSIMDKVKETDHVSAVSSQIYLASLRASCCTIPVQLIGFDPENDFTVKAWVNESYGKELEDLDVIVGSRVNTEVGEQIRIYEQDCNVVGSLSATGTDMDTAVYATQDTIRLLLKAAQDLGHDLKVSDPDSVVSAIYVKVEEGWDVEKVANDLNIHLRKAEAVQTRPMLTDVSDAMSGIASVMRLLLVIIWIVVLVLILSAFHLILRERKREFASLRVIGASGRMITGMVLKESLILCLIGGVAGTALGALFVLPFSGLIEDSLGLPFLMPGTGVIILLAVVTVVIVTVTGLAASFFGARKAGTLETSYILRGEN